MFNMQLRVFKKRRVISFKFLFILSLFVITSLLFVKQVHAATNDVNLYLFWGEGCPHCAKEKVFISEISGDFPNLKVHLFEVYKNNQNQEYFKEVGEALGENVSGVPFTVIGDKGINWF